MLDLLIVEDGDQEREVDVKVLGLKGFDVLGLAETFINKEEEVSMTE